MIFLQASEVVTTAFKLDFVVGAAAVIIITLSAVIVFLWKELKAERKANTDLTVNVTTVAINNAHAMEKISEAMDRIPALHKSTTEQIKEAIRNSNDQILRTIDKK